MKALSMIDMDMIEDEEGEALFLSDAPRYLLTSQRLNRIMKKVI